MKPFILPLLLVFSSSALAANSLIRVDCMEGSAGADVSLNGEYQFTCRDYQKEPIYLEAGDYTITAVKRLAKEYQQLFTQQLSLLAGEPRRVRVVLPAKTLTAYGKAQKKQRQETARLAAETEAKRQRELAVQEDITGAESGEPDAMKRLAERYEKGDGIPKDAETAKYWQQQLALTNLKRQMQSTSYFAYTSAVPQLFEQAGANPSDLLTVTFVAPAAPLFDSTSMPTVTTDRNNIQKRIDELKTHASRWAKPDSMVAKAYRTRQLD